MLKLRPEQRVLFAQTRNTTRPRFFPLLSFLGNSQQPGRTSLAVTRAASNGRQPVSEMIVRMSRNGSSVTSPRTSSDSAGEISVSRCEASGFSMPLIGLKGIFLAFAAQLNARQRAVMQPR